MMDGPLRMMDPVKANDRRRLWVLVAEHAISVEMICFTLSIFQSFLDRLYSKHTNDGYQTVR